MDFLLKPYYQGLLSIVATILILGVVRPKDQELLWTISGVMYAVFIIVNVVGSNFHQPVWTYFFISLLVSVVYIFAAQIITNAYISIRNPTGSGESGMIFLIIIYHPFLLLLMIFLKWLYLKLF